MAGGQPAKLVLTESVPERADNDAVSVNGERVKFGFCFFSCTPVSAPSFNGLSTACGFSHL